MPLDPDRLCATLHEPAHDRAQRESGFDAQPEAPSGPGPCPAALAWSEQLPCAAAPGRVLAVTLRHPRPAGLMPGCQRHGWLCRQRRQAGGPLHLVAGSAREMPPRPFKPGTGHYGCWTGAPGCLAGTWAVVPRETGPGWPGGCGWTVGQARPPSGAKAASWRPMPCLVKAGTVFAPGTWACPGLAGGDGGEWSGAAGGGHGALGGQRAARGRTAAGAKASSMTPTGLNDGHAGRDGMREVGTAGSWPMTRLGAQSLLAARLRASDLAISSAGVSVGDADHVRAVLADVGEVSHWQVAIKPGKPFTWGRVGGTPPGLAGHPRSRPP